MGPVALTCWTGWAMTTCGSVGAATATAATGAAAEAIGWEDRIGTLGVGREADVAVLSLDGVDVELEDCQGQMRRIQHRLSASAVWRAGVPGKITQPLRWPNPEPLETLRSYIPMLRIGDQ